MCRLAAFPPGTSREEALTILEKMEDGWNGKNKDGFGYSYIVTDAQKGNRIQTFKWALSFSELLKRKYPLLNHMPANCWTIAHQRAASCGGVTKENSHPFVVGKGGEWSICHNGGFRRHGIVGLTLSKFVNFKGTTDSEVAANLINFIGPREFAMNEEIDDAGVYLCLNRNGSLEIVMNSGTLRFVANEKTNTSIFSSQFSYNNYSDPSVVMRGWYKFNPDGTLADHKKREYYTGKSYTWVTGGGSVRRAARAMDIVGTGVDNNVAHAFHQSHFPGVMSDV